MNTITYYKGGGYGGFPSEAEELKKIKWNEGFSFKVRVHKFIFYFLQGSQNSQNYKFAPQIPDIITSTAQLPENI